MASQVDPTVLGKMTKLQRINAALHNQGVDRPHPRFQALVSQRLGAGLGRSGQEGDDGALLAGRLSAYDRHGTTPRGSTATGSSAETLLM